MIKFKDEFLKIIQKANKDMSCEEIDIMMYCYMDLTDKIDKAKNEDERKNLIDLTKLIKQYHPEIHSGGNIPKELSEPTAPLSASGERLKYNQ